MEKHKICSRCVMDDTAEEITFDSNGICSFCHWFDKKVKPVLDRVNFGASQRSLDFLIKKIKDSARGKPYDSVLGLSGGVDSSYLTYIAIYKGLRPLAVHVDTGWNTPESEGNIRKLATQLGVDLKIVYIDKEEMADLQLAFYKSSVKNCEIPQDHAFLAALYKEAAQIGVHYILTGGNFVSESILPKSWGYNAGDLRHLLAIHKRFGTRSLCNFPTLSFWKRYLYYPFIRHIREVRLLNYLPYNRGQAKSFLNEKFGWIDYGAKHYESVLTRFFQGYYLPMKFGIDKRKAHFSSLILSGQMSRDEALEELKKSPYPNDELLESDMAFIAQRLGLSLAEFKDLISQPPHKHEDFPSSKVLFDIKDVLVGLIRKTGLK